MRRRAPVVARDDVFRQPRHASDRYVREIQGRLLVLHEARIEDGAFVAGVRGDDGEAARERRRDRPRPRAPSGMPTRPFSPPPPCIRKPAVPVVGQRDGEADAECLSTHALSAIDRAVHAAVGGQRARECRERRIRRHRTGSDPFGLVDRQRRPAMASVASAAHARPR